MHLCYCGFCVVCILSQYCSNCTMSTSHGLWQVEGLTVETLLNKFVTLESVDDVVCDKCQRSASFIKKLTLGKVREVLLLLL